MNVSNHMVVGAAVGLTFSRPAIALPVAIVSHFVLDALPHYGFERQGFNVWIKEKTAGIMVVFDAACLAILATTLLMNQLYFAFFVAWVALLPDSVWIYRYFRYERKNRKPHYNTLDRFHLAIQWCERPWGLYVEMTMFIVAFGLLQYFLI